MGGMNGWYDTMALGMIHWYVYYVSVASKSFNALALSPFVWCTHPMGNTRTLTARFTKPWLFHQMARTSSGGSVRPCMAYSNLFRPTDPLLLLPPGFLTFQNIEGQISGQRTWEWVERRTWWMGQAGKLAVLMGSSFVEEVARWKIKQQFLNSTSS